MLSVRGQVGWRNELGVGKANHCCLQGMTLQNEEPGETAFYLLANVYCDCFGGFFK